MALTKKLIEVIKYLPKSLISNCSLNNKISNSILELNVKTYSNNNILSKYIPEKKRKNFKINYLKF